MTKQNDTKLKRVHLIGGAIGLAITAAALGLGVWPIWQQHHHNAKLQQQLRQRHQEAETLAGQLDELRGTLRRTKRLVADHPLRLKSLERLNHRLSRLTNLADDNGLSIDTLQPADAKSARHFHRVPIEMSGRGQFSEAQQFLQQLHQRVPDITLARLSLDGRPGQPDEPATFSFDLLWYAAPDTNRPSPQDRDNDTSLSANASR